VTSPSWVALAFAIGRCLIKGGGLDFGCIVHDGGQKYMQGANERRVIACMQLRHPDVLKFQETVEVEEKGKFVIYLVTEPVQSLDLVIKSLVFEGNDYEKFAMMGLQQIVSALSFLGNDCSLIHGNVCSRSVMVTDTLDWKLHAFDLTTEHALVAQISAGPPLLASSWLVAPQYKSGELGRSEWDVIAGGPVWAVDAWGLGCLIQEVFSKVPLTKMEDLKRLDCIPLKIKPYYQVSN